MSAGEAFLLTFVVSVYGAIALAIAYGVRQHVRKHPHGPHRPAKVIELIITQQRGR